MLYKFAVVYGIHVDVEIFCKGCSHQPWRPVTTFQTDCFVRSAPVSIWKSIAARQISVHWLPNLVHAHLFSAHVLTPEIIYLTKCAKMCMNMQRITWCIKHPSGRGNDNHDRCAPPSICIKQPSLCPSYTSCMLALDKLGMTFQIAMQGIVLWLSL
jgi:hypothetical protein